MVERIHPVFHYNQMTGILVLQRRLTGDTRLFAFIYVSTAVYVSELGNFVYVHVCFSLHCLCLSQMIFNRMCSCAIECHVILFLTDKAVQTKQVVHITDSISFPTMYFPVLLSFRSVPWDSFSVQIYSNHEAKFWTAEQWFGFNILLWVHYSR